MGLLINLKTKMMKKIYLNMITSAGIETVDELIPELDQSPKDFRVYVRKMVEEYHLAGMNVYRSSRCTKYWNNK